jgi:D-3-phosphoglycerate dehydrogenase
MLILIADAFDKSLPEKLKKFGEVTDDSARLIDAEVVLIRSKTKATKEYIDQAPKLKYIIRGGVGLDNVDSKYAESKGIKVANTPEASSVAVAELAFALMIAIPNKIIEAHNSMCEGKFLKKELKRTELFQKTLGLIGMGRIASEVAKRALAFGMKVVAYDPFVKKSDYATMKSLDETLKEADYISIHTPLCPETQGMINNESIAKMKKGVVIINTGRAKCVKPDDIIAALGSGHVAAYGTDVWMKDDVDPECKVRKTKNVYMAPHLGASTKENLLRIGETVERLLDEYTKKGHQKTVSQGGH